ncbi:serine/threonine-protein kinase [Pseudofrankia sp. BMG5.37]|uniref:WD40 repeat domain-containing serine/threonine protein kinase n=1 Tax=Pseudofrankia sp. BMG5.37 TaxID=3050035 RepID=UPI002893FF53|nr:serine/threonine-protein kinase [Pseudofrankia sp. BMG5.37]MDT3444767.1 serine/threonine-protein kinase [Pseudofrankia sp. BMG5.37]
MADARRIQNVTAGRSARIWGVGEFVLDLYDVLDVIQTGGMGLVYKVRHRGWNIDLAVKTPRMEFAVSERGRVAFETEAEAWVGLGLHPHVVSCAYIRRIDGVPHVFAEWVDGGSLADAVRDRRIYRGGPAAALRRILDVAIQFAWGLAHAHQHGLVHQDVKPANVMLARDGTVKVTDFGLAKGPDLAGEPAGAAGRPVLAGATVLATFAGRTPAYCSPEQADAAAGGHVRLSRATDVWSWAVSVLELFAGEPPTSFGQVAREVFEAFVQRPPADPELPALPSEIVSLLRRCFQEQPAARPSRMDQLADELIGIYQRVIGGTYPRARPSGVRLLADGLSNQALSMLDLGHPERAEALWARALQADPHHTPAVYNRGLNRWRTGRGSDAQLVAELEGVRAGHRQQDWVDDYLLALVHLERGDPDSAIPLLEMAATRAGDGDGVGSAAGFAAGFADVDAALARARQMPRPRQPDTLTGHANPVAAVAMSGDGRIAASADRDASIPPRPDGAPIDIRVWDVATGRCLQVLRGHDRGVETVALSRDGRLLASGGVDQAVLVWDVPSGRLLRRLTGHTGSVRSVSVSPDGATLVSLADDGRILSWEVATGRLVRTLRQERTSVSSFGESVTVTDGGRRVVHWDYPTRRLRVWALRTGHLEHSRQFRHYGVVVGTGGRHALVTGEGKAQVWNTETMRVEREFELGREFGALSADGRHAVGGGAAGTEVWELTTPRCLRTMPFSSHQTALSADGRSGISLANADLRLWTAGAAGPPSPWSYARPRPATEMSRDADVVSTAIARSRQLARQGQWGAAAQELRRARDRPGYEHDLDILDQWAKVGGRGRRVGLLSTWHLRDLASAPDDLRDGLSIPIGNTRGFAPLLENGFALSPDGRFALTRHRSGLRIQDTATGEVHQTLSTYGPEFRCAVFSPDSRSVLTGNSDYYLQVWDVQSGECRVTLGDHPDSVEAVVMSVDGRLAVAGCLDGTIKVWDLAAGRCLRTLKKADRFVTALTVSPDCRILISHEFELTSDYHNLHFAQVWDLEQGRLLQTTPCWVVSADSTRISDDGRIGLSISSLQNSLRVFDPLTGRLETMLLSGPGKLSRVAMTPDGRLGCTAGSEGALMVWDLSAASRPMRVLTGHTGEVTSLVLTPDGRFALTGGADGSVRVWDLAAGRCLRTLAAHTGSVLSVRCSSDARTVLSLGQDKKAKVWQLAWDYEFPQPADWDQDARPYVDAFLARRRWVDAAWTDDDVEGLLDVLRDAGLGWLRPDGVRAELARAAATRNAGVPSLSAGGPGVPGHDSDNSGRTFERAEERGAWPVF